MSLEEIRSLFVVNLTCANSELNTDGEKKMSEKIKKGDNQLKEREKER